MKNSTPIRDRLSLPEFLAYCGVSAALRPFRRCKHYAVALILENWDERHSYFTAGKAFIRSYSEDLWQPGGCPLIFKEAKSDECLNDIAKELLRGQAIILFQDAAAIPREVRPAFDAIIFVPTATARQIKGAMQQLYRTKISEADAQIIVQHPWQRLRLMLRPGRSIARIISDFAKVQATNPTNKETESSGPRLEELHGYGEAKSWASTWPRPERLASGKNRLERRRSGCASFRAARRRKDKVCTGSWANLWGSRNLGICCEMAGERPYGRPPEGHEEGLR